MFKIPRAVTYIFKWVFNLLGIVLDIRELIAIFAGGGMVTLATILKLVTETIPLWAIILITLVVFMFSFTVLSLILGKHKKIDNLEKITEIIKNMNNRTNKIALKLGNKLKNIEMPDGLENDFGKLFELTEARIKTLRIAHPLRPYEERFILKKARKIIGDDIIGFSRKIVVLTDKHNVGLQENIQGDFQYMFYEDQLSNAKPLPNDKVNNLVELYLDLSLGLNTLLMLQQARQKEIDQNMSLDFQITSRVYPKVMEKQLNFTLIQINEAIREYKKESNSLSKHGKVK